MLRGGRTSEVKIAACARRSTPRFAAWFRLVAAPQIFIRPPAPDWLTFKNSAQAARLLRCGRSMQMTVLYPTQQPRRICMHITDEEFDSVIKLLNFVYHPADHGCVIDFGDEGTRWERVDHIVDEANATVAAILVRCAAANDDWTERCIAT
jgi:hypothetical protein